MGNLSMRKISEILRQRLAMGRSYREIGRSLNISISTVSDYVTRAKLAGLNDWEQIVPLTEEALYARLFLPVSKKTKTRTHPNYEWVYKELRQKGVTLRLLWREYRSQHPDGLGYSQFCVGYQAYKRTLKLCMRQNHKAGEKTFVDYAGMTLAWIEQATGEIHTAQIFVGCLGASQYIYVEATATQQVSDWIASHVRMFEFFGGVSDIVVPDNLKAAVIKAHRYDPDINVNYQMWGRHYGVAIVPARSRKPQDKAKVENAVGCIERHILAPLRHRTFTSLEDINQAIQPLLKIFNAQHFQKMQGSRLSLFNDIERSALKPLPKVRYVYQTWHQAKVNIDYHIIYQKNFYSVPYAYAHKKVELCCTGNTIEIFYQAKRIAVHDIRMGNYQFNTKAEHMPQNHQYQAKWTPERLEAWARRSGDKTEAFIHQLIQAKDFPQQAFRACLGVMRLGQRYGYERLEQACAKALTLGITRYQSIEAMLKNNLESVTEPVTTTPQVPHENIRGETYYQ